MIDDEKTEKKSSTQAAIRRRRRYLAEHMDERCIQYLEEYFGTNLPCFQKMPCGTPDSSRFTFDPLDAMRRDAYREVCLFLRRELTLYQQQKNND